MVQWAEVVRCSMQETCAFGDKEMVPREPTVQDVDDIAALVEKMEVVDFDQESSPCFVVDQMGDIVD